MPDVKPLAVLNALEGDKWALETPSSGRAAMRRLVPKELFVSNTVLVHIGARFVAEELRERLIEVDELLSVRASLGPVLIDIRYSTSARRDVLRGRYIPSLGETTGTSPEGRMRSSKLLPDQRKVDTRTPLVSDAPRLCVSPMLAFRPWPMAEVHIS